MSAEAGSNGINWREVDQALSQFEGNRRLGGRSDLLEALSRRITVVAPPLSAAFFDTGDYMIAENPLDTHLPLFLNYNDNRWHKR